MRTHTSSAVRRQPAAPVEERPAGPPLVKRRAGPGQVSYKRLDKVARHASCSVGVLRGGDREHLVIPRYALTAYLQKRHSSCMAKLTVYIPDDLLDRARRQDEAANTSQLVQRGLERLVGIDSAPYAQRPADAGALLAKSRERLAPAAAAEYERGYRASLNTLDERFWVVLDGLARQGFDLGRWASGWRNGIVDGHDEPEWWEPLADDLGTVIDPIGFDRWSFTPTAAFVRGYEAALRDAWDAVEQVTIPDSNTAGDGQHGQEAQTPTDVP